MSPNPFRSTGLVLGFCALSSLAGAQELTRVGGQLTLPGPIEFDIDSATLRASSLATIDQLAEWLRAHPEVRVEIQAHTDPEWVCEHCGRRLTRDRAHSVLAALVDRGVARDRLEARGVRGEQPLAVCDQSNRRRRWACQARNRRIEIKLL